MDTQQTTMNNRIEEIAKEVFSFKYKTAPNELNPGHHMDHLHKFAELIAQECAKICKTVGGDKVSNASKDYQEGREMGAEVCYNQIKEHFGVE